MEEEKTSVLTMIENNKEQISRTLDKIDLLLKLQEDMFIKQEETIIKNFKQDQYDQREIMQREESVLEECQQKSVQLLENIYYLITKVDKNFDEILKNLPKCAQANQFKKNNELDLVTNKLLLDSLNGNLESCGQIIDESKYLLGFKQNR